MPDPLDKAVEAVDVWHKDGPLAQIEAMARWAERLADPTRNADWETAGKIAKNIRAALPHLPSPEQGFRCDKYNERRSYPCSECSDPRCCEVGSPLPDPEQVREDTDAVEAVREAIIMEVGKRLDWNVRAYGQAWTGEDGDTEFIVGDSATKVLEAARPHIVAVALREVEEALEAEKDVIGLQWFRDRFLAPAPTSEEESNG